MNKNYYLYGNDVAISEFITNNRDKINISGIIIGRREDERNWNFYSQIEGEIDKKSSYKYNYSIFDLDKDFDVIKQGIIVICQKGILVNGIEDYFDYKGLKFETDYTYSSLIEIELSEKDIVVLHGYFCFVRDLYIILNSIDLFHEKFYLLAAIYEENLKYPYHKVMNQVLQKTNIYIYNRESKPYYYNKSELSHECKTICMPCVNFGAFHPQIIRRGAHYNNPLYITPQGPDRVYRFGDKYVNEMILKGLSNKSIYDTVSTSDFLGRFEIEQLMQRELRIMKAFEKDCDIKISGYVIENYKKKRLFPICDHWSLNIAIEFANQILILLGITNANISIKEPPKRYTEVPIYPCVGHALGIEWVDETTTYYMRVGEECRTYTFEEYINIYCDVMRSMLAIQRIW